jgi:hypothetical protein
MAAAGAVKDALATGGVDKVMLEKVLGFLTYTVTSRDVNFRYPNRMSMTEFAHIAKKISAMWAGRKLVSSDRCCPQPPELSVGNILP